MYRAAATMALVATVTIAPGAAVLAADDAAGTPTTVVAPGVATTIAGAVPEASVATPVGDGDDGDDGDKTGLWGLLGLLGLAGLAPRRRPADNERVVTSGATRVQR
jgi:MYXO-CTERM domain-containing protein